MRSYMVWNPEFIANSSHTNLPTTTYKELLAVEAYEDCSWSSVVNTDDIESVITMAQNECNASLEYHQLKPREDD